MPSADYQYRDHASLKLYSLFSKQYLNYVLVLESGSNYHDSCERCSTKKKLGNLLGDEKRYFNAHTAESFHLSPKRIDRDITRRLGATVSTVDLDLLVPD